MTRADHGYCSLMSTALTVDRLRPGDHACLTFSDPEERLDLLAAFVADGLAQGDTVVCYSDDADGLRKELHERTDSAVRVEPVARLWGDSGPAARTMVDRLTEELAGAGRRLRITADTCWAARPHANAEQLLAFESEVAGLFQAGRLTAICQYDRESFDPVTLAYAARVHPRTIAAAVYHEDPVVRICRQHVPPGVRVAGELDYTRAEALSDALAEAVRLDRDVHLNLNHLRFIDAGAAGVILRTAAGLPETRRMVVTCTEPVNRTLSTAGAAEIPNLRMLVRHGDR